MTTAEIKLPYDIADAHPSVQEFYRKLIARGESPRMAEMLALRQAPRGMTDSVFFEGTKPIGKAYGNYQQGLEQLVDRAKKNGYTPNANDVYDSGLARFPGDPEAFIPPSGGRGYVKRLLEKRGWSAEGAVSVKGRQPERDPNEGKPKLADKVANKLVDHMVKKNPDLKRVDRRELKAEVVHKHGAKK